MDLHRSSGRSGLGFTLAATTMLLWGVLPFGLKIVLAAMDPQTITWWRFLFSTLVLGAILAARGAWPRLSGLGRAGWVLLAVATLGLAANYLAYLLGLHLTTPATSQVLIQLAPLLLALGAIVVFGERFVRWQWLGFALLVSGLLLFFSAQLRALASGAERWLLGAFFIGVAAVTWAIYGLAQKQLLHWLPSQPLMLCVYAGCTLCFTPVADPGAIRALDALQLGALLFCALNTLAAYGAFSAALQHWEASRVSAVLALTPLATLTISALVSSVAPQWVAPERIPATSWLGAAGVVLGSLAMSLAGGTAPQPPGAVVEPQPAQSA
jgi:drug/metabolite transporter (DMT)-like permease